MNITVPAVFANWAIEAHFERHKSLYQDVIYGAMSQPNKLLVFVCGPTLQPRLELFVIV